jgi:hypothetical protein
LLDTAAVVTVNEFEVSPAAMLTPAGTEAGDVPDKVTAAPPAGAGPLKVTVQEVAEPPTTEAGLQARDETFGAGRVTLMVPLAAVVDRAAPEASTL